MTEIAILGCIFALVSGMRHRKEGFLNALNGIGFDFTNGVIEGWVGEFSIEIIETLIEDISAHNRKRKALARMGKNILERMSAPENQDLNFDVLLIYLQNLPDSDDKKTNRSRKRLKEFCNEFLQVLKIQIEAQRKLNAALQECETDKKTQKRHKKAYNKTMAQCCKRFCVALDKVLEPIDENISEQLANKSIDEIAKEIFEIDDAPDQVMRIICECMKECVFELKYAKFADDKRDIVKVMQYVVNDSLEQNIVKSLLPALEDYFQLILQQNAILQNTPLPPEGEKKTPAVRIAEMAKKDPLILIEHACPKCGARGQLVSRKADLLICSKCERSFSIFHPDYDESELERKFVLFYDQMQDLHNQVKKQIQSSGQEVVQSVGQKIDEAAAALIMSNSDILKELLYIESSIEGAVSSIENLAQKVVDSLNKMENAAEEIEKLVVGQKRLHNEHQRILLLVSEMKNVDEARWQQLLKILDELHLVSSVAPGADSIRYLTFEITKTEQKKIRMQCVNEAEAEAKQSGQALIIIKSGAQYLSESTQLRPSFSPDICGRITRIMILGESDINIHVDSISTIASFFCNAKVIFLGDSVGYDGSEIQSWDYNRDRRTFTRIHKA